MPELVDSKSVDPESGTAVAAGDTVTCTLTFQNAGTAPAAVDRVDDLSGVLDDAEFVADSIVIDPDDTVAASLNGDRIVIVGAVPAATTVTVTYAVTVLPDGERGDNLLGNFLLDRGRIRQRSAGTTNPTARSIQHHLVARSRPRRNRASSLLEQRRVSPKRPRCLGRVRTSWHSCCFPSS